MNPSAIEGHLTLVLIQWMIIIAAAFIFGRLGRRFLGQPLAVGEIAAGIILGPSVFGAGCAALAGYFDKIILRTTSAISPELEVRVFGIIRDPSDSNQPTAQ